MLFLQSLFQSMAAKSQTHTERTLIERLSQEFAHLYSQWCSLVNRCPEDSIYREGRTSDGVVLAAVGEMVLRSAAVVEQTCGGLTANLWDDPFEWTLPETLVTRASIVAYLEEVEATRKRAFLSFRSDEDLSRMIALPSGQMCSLSEILEQSLTKAARFYSTALSTAKINCRA